MKNPRVGKYYSVVPSFYNSDMALGFEDVVMHARGKWTVATGLRGIDAIKLLASLEKMMESQAPYSITSDKKICHT